jgi:hypothetical protein
LASLSPLFPTNAATTATVATTASTTAKTIAAVGHRRLGTGGGVSVGYWDGDRICVSAKAGSTTRGSVGTVGGVSLGANRVNNGNPCGGVFVESAP